MFNEKIKDIKTQVAQTLIGAYLSGVSENVASIGEKTSLKALGETFMNFGTPIDLVNEDLVNLNDFNSAPKAGGVLSNLIKQSKSKIDNYCDNVKSLNLSLAESVDLAVDFANKVQEAATPLAYSEGSKDEDLKNDIRVLLKEGKQEFIKREKEEELQEKKTTTDVAEEELQQDEDEVMDDDPTKGFDEVDDEDVAEEDEEENDEDEEELEEFTEEDEDEEFSSEIPTGKAESVDLMTDFGTSDDEIEFRVSKIDTSHEDYEKYTNDLDINDTQAVYDILIDKRKELIDIIKSKAPEYKKKYNAAIEKHLLENDDLPKDIKRYASHNVFINLDLVDKYKEIVFLTRWLFVNDKPKSSLLYNFVKIIAIIHNKIKPIGEKSGNKKLYSYNDYRTQLFSIRDAFGSESSGYGGISEDKYDYMRDVVYQQLDRIDALIENAEKNEELTSRLESVFHSAAGESVKITEDLLKDDMKLNRLLNDINLGKGYAEEFKYVYNDSIITTSPFQMKKMVKDLLSVEKESLKVISESANMSQLIEDDILQDTHRNTVNEFGVIMCARNKFRQ